MSNIFKKLFGSLTEKPWEKDQAAIDSYHQGRTFNISTQTSAVIVIFGVSTVLFSLIFMGYLYSVPQEQDTRFLLRPNLLWFNTLVLFFVTYYFSKITNDLKKNNPTRIKKNLILVGALSYLFLFGQTFFWFQLMKSGKFVSTNSYFSSFYFFTALHGLHLLGGLFFWGRVCSKTLKLKQEEIINQKKSIDALSLYWTFLLIVWLLFFLTMYIFNDTVIAWCKSLLS
jgi:cytochrome c oxidase subunit 3|tara:strand:- start:93 stop:773 length:681 start_codon:yes stop_codon:yes gene_type:complete